MVPHSWLIQCMQTFKISDKVITLLGKSMESWRVELTSGNDKLREVKIRRGIFQGDTLSPLLFVLALILLTTLLNGLDQGYRMGKNRGKINHLLFMDDLKLYGRNMQELDSLVQSVRIFSTDIGMAFGIEKCAAVKNSTGRVVESEGIELPNRDTIKELEENDGYKYLGILECDKIKSSEMKEKIKKEYFRRVKLMLKSKLSAGNVIMAVNSRAVSLLRYGAGIVD